MSCPRAIWQSEAYRVIELEPSRFRCEKKVALPADTLGQSATHWIPCPEIEAARAVFQDLAASSGPSLTVLTDEAKRAKVGGER